ncbi:diacylglycerol/lipid kinase family protein [Urbifossiella limnaea]|nr:diacylglycerol kinase family protein [Urbifossiella limnaea]
MTPATCVIYNPAAGRGRAEALLKEFTANPGVHGELRPTTAPGHAEELARAAADEGFARVVAAGGDGTVHEVANGLIRSGRRDVVFSTWPVGSANDYAYTLGLTAWWAKRAENPPMETLDVDVARVTAGGRERYAVNAAGVGFNGMVTVESRKIRSLRGMPLYTLAFLKAMVRHFATPRMRVRFDDTEYSGPALALTLCLAQREGGFPLMPAADLTDGKLDYMLATKLRRWHLLRYLPAMATGTLPTNHPLIRLGRAARVTVESDAPLCAHADGELVCVPADGVTELAVEVLPGRLRVEVYPPGLYGGRRPPGGTGGR